MQINRLGVVPKGCAAGKWHLITDLSFLEGRSVNDGIDLLVCSLRYMTVNKVARAAGRLGVGTLLAKLDIRSAYRLIPVHPDDRPLLGFQWQGVQYVDGMLPFGLHSAPKIFTAIANALEWVARQRGVPEIDHYLDSRAACHSRLPKEPRYYHPNLHGSWHPLSVGEAGGAHNLSYIPGD